MEGKSPSDAQTQKSLFFGAAREEKISNIKHR
jgi:hypothetical protein